MILEEIWKIPFNLDMADCIKVEKIWVDILDWIPSPSPSVKLLAGKFTCGNKAKHCFANQHFFVFKSLLIDNAQQCFASTPQANFTVHNLNFYWRWRWWDRIQAKYLLKSFLLYWIYLLYTCYKLQHHRGINLELLCVDTFDKISSFIQNLTKILWKQYVLSLSRQYVWKNFTQNFMYFVENPNFVNFAVKKHQKAEIEKIKLSKIFNTVIN